MTLEEDKENQHGTTKRNKLLNLSLKKSKKKTLQCESGADESQKLSRFTSPCSEQELDKLAEDFKPVNTEMSTELCRTTRYSYSRCNFHKLACIRSSYMCDKSLLNLLITTPSNPLTSFSIFNGSFHDLVDARPVFGSQVGALKSAACTLLSFILPFPLCFFCSTA